HARPPARRKSAAANLPRLVRAPRLDAARAPACADREGAGRPLERTVLFYAQWLASHERTHLKQIGRVAGTAR
ncbi:MAG TPA: hypothetical protein PLO33_15500, partial [Kouleothrix sp.]|nr:hypothetical protein [Kouleothrix sp.]